MTLRDVLSRLTDERLDVGRIFLSGLSTAIGHYELANGSSDLKRLSAEGVRTMMRAVTATGRANKTANNYRGAILYLWDLALEYSIRDRQDWGIPECPRLAIKKLKEPRRVPKAWPADEFSLIIKSCRAARTRRGWGPMEWEALVLCIYDTSLRVGCLRKSAIEQLDAKRNMLYVPGEMQKSGCDTWQRLHADTVRKLLKMRRVPGDKRLIPWPFHKDELWRHFTREILAPAGLPATRRDKFHKIRRTSYTLVAKTYGIAAASEHAAHKEDLSRFYLDPTLMDRPNPLDALPRPFEA